MSNRLKSSLTTKSVWLLAKNYKICYDELHLPNMVTAEKVENYRWPGYDFSGHDIKVLDTTFRDGAQDSDIRYPSLEEKSEYIALLPQIGVNIVDIAIPIAGGLHFRDAVKLAHILDDSIEITCLARTRLEDIDAVLRLADSAGRSVKPIIFVGSSALRMNAEGWDLGDIVGWMENTVRYAVSRGLEPTIATEHTTETEPSVRSLLYKVGLENGGKRVCIADTTGWADPLMTDGIVRSFKEDVLKGFGDVEIEWHGHNDLGLALANSLAAIHAGASIVHATSLGIGERAGNTSLEQLLQVLKKLGDPRRQDIHLVPELAKLSSRLFNVPIGRDHPGFGEKVNTWSSGIHTEAALEARRKGLKPGPIYSAVDSEGWYGIPTHFNVGPLSGESNVLIIAEELGLKPTVRFTKAALDFAKTANRVLTKEDILNIYHSLEPNGDS